MMSWNWLKSVFFHARSNAAVGQAVPASFDESEVRFSAA